MRKELRERLDVARATIARVAGGNGSQEELRAAERDENAVWDTVRGEAAQTCGDCGNVIVDRRGHDEDCASIGQPGTFA